MGFARCASAVIRLKQAMNGGEFETEEAVKAKADEVAATISSADQPQAELSYDARVFVYKYLLQKRQDFWTKLNLVVFGRHTVETLIQSTGFAYITLERYVSCDDTTRYEWSRQCLGCASCSWISKGKSDG